MYECLGLIVLFLSFVLKEEGEVVWWCEVFGVGGVSCSALLVRWVLLLVVLFMFCF